MGIIGLGNKRILPPPFRPYVWGFVREGQGHFPSGEPVDVGGLTPPPDGNGGEVLEDFEAGDLSAYYTMRDGVPWGYDFWALVTTKVPEGTYALTAVGEGATYNDLIHSTGLTPRGYEYRWTVRKVALPGSDLYLLFAVQDWLHCYALYVNTHAGTIFGGQMDGAPDPTGTGPMVEKEFVVDEDVVVFCRWDEDGLLTYGSGEATETYQTTLGYTTGTWGWRKYDVEPAEGDRNRWDSLTKAPLP